MNSRKNVSIPGDPTEGSTRPEGRVKSGIAWCRKFRGYAARGADGLWRDLQGKVLKQIESAQ